MSGAQIVGHLLLDRLLVIGAVFVALAVLMLVVAWALRTGRR